MSAFLSSSGKVLDEIHSFVQFVIGTVHSSLAILIIFVGMPPLELLLQLISLIYFKTRFVDTNSSLKSKEC